MMKLLLIDNLPGCVYVCVRVRDSVSQWSLPRDRHLVIKL